MRYMMLPLPISVDCCLMCVIVAKSTFRRLSDRKDLITPNYLIRQFHSTSFFISMTTITCILISKILVWLQQYLMRYINFFAKSIVNIRGSEADLRHLWPLSRYDRSHRKKGEMPMKTLTATFQRLQLPIPLFPLYTTPLY